LKNNHQMGLRWLLSFGLIFITILVFSFAMFNKPTTANNLANCESCNKKATGNLDLVPKEPEISVVELEEMRTEIYKNKYTFTVSQNATEYHRYGLNYYGDQVYKTAPEAPEYKLDPDLPAKFDWREKNGVSPVKNQGNCASCWAFSTVGIMESAILIKERKRVDLSEQYLISCNTSGWGCKKGWWAHGYHINPGAIMERCFPYQAAEVPCKSNCPHRYKIDSWFFINSKDSIPYVESIQGAILKYGPIAASVAVDKYFIAYSGGVFNRNYEAVPNHAVILVGWDDTQNCWILKNSWGTSWGESGYMRIGYNISMVGCWANYVVYKGESSSNR